MNAEPQKRCRPGGGSGILVTGEVDTASVARKPLIKVPCTRVARQDRQSQLRRRHAAGLRSVPLDCGCRDPLLCRCTFPPLSEHSIDSWRDAALHVLGQGQMPVLPIEVRRALWKRGGADRVLAELLHDACGGDAT